MGPGRQRTCAILIASMVAASVTAAPAYGTDEAGPIGPAMAPLDLVSTPSVTLADCVASVRDAWVTVTVAPPSGAASWLRLSGS